MKITYRPFGSYIDNEICLDSINIISKHPETNIETTVTLEDFISKMMYKIDQLEKKIAELKELSPTKIEGYEYTNNDIQRMLYETFKIR